MKGIPSRIPSTGFRTSVLTSNTGRSTANRPLSGRKDCAIKIIDINEQPLGYVQAKKRKRMLGSYPNKHFDNQYLKKITNIYAFRICTLTISLKLQRLSNKMKRSE